jgi:dTDP-4-dehydrorhamnose reductase
MLEHLEAGKPVRGIAQWSGAEPMTKFDMARRIAGALALNACIEAQQTAVETTPRPRDCHLDSSRLESLGIGCRTPFDTALSRVLDAFPFRPHPRS